MVATRARRSWRPYARLSTSLTKQSRSREEKREKIRRAGRSSTQVPQGAELRNNGASPVDQRAKLNEARYTRPKRRTLSLRHAPACWCTSHGACLLRPGLWQSLEERQKPLRSRRLEIRSSGTEPRPEPECLSNSNPRICRKLTALKQQLLPGDGHTTLHTPQRASARSVLGR